MAYLKLERSFRRLSNEVLAQWTLIPTAVATDCMNRTMSMDGGIKAITDGVSLCGQARTVAAMSGDCGAVSVASEDTAAGDVLVVDALGSLNVAVWGGLLTEAAAKNGLGGVVIDGAVRDARDIRQLRFPVFCRSIVPRGPHEGFGGTIDCDVAVGGVSVRPGDLVLGDDDGVVIVPLAEVETVYERAKAHLMKEAKWLRRIRRGDRISEMFSMPKPFNAHQHEDTE